MTHFIYLYSLLIDSKSLQNCTYKLLLRYFNRYIKIIVEVQCKICFQNNFKTNIFNILILNLSSKDNMFYTSFVGVSNLFDHNILSS